MKNETDFYRAVTNLDVDVELEDHEGYLEINVAIHHPESGLRQDIRFPYSPDEHPDFNTEIGNEIYSWAQLMWDEYNEKMFEVVEVCPHCDHENVYKNYKVEEHGYMAKCQHCGKIIMLCDECCHADDNPDQHCNWNAENGCGSCKRGMTREY